MSAAVIGRWTLAIAHRHCRHLLPDARERLERGWGVWQSLDPVDVLPDCRDARLALFTSELGTKGCTWPIGANLAGQPPVVSRRSPAPLCGSFRRDRDRRSNDANGLTTREAGRLLGIPAGTVKTRMMRARAEMRGALT